MHCLELKTDFIFPQKNIVTGLKEKKVELNQLFLDYFAFLLKGLNFNDFASALSIFSW